MAHSRLMKIGIMAAIMWQVCSAPVLTAGLAGTKHDFARQDPDNPFRELGQPCTPCHRYLHSPPQATINGRPVRVKASLVCLACHAGACELAEVKVDRKFIQDYTFHHPVDVPMPVDDPGFASIQEARAKGIVFYGEDHLIACTSCHDTHNAKGYPYFLRDLTDQGQLCRDCHNK